MPKGNLTIEEKAAQVRFKAIWEAWQAEDEKGRTQQLIADQLGINQPSLGQYINGRNPLNIVFLLKVCSIIKTDPRKIYPEIFKDIDFSIIGVTGDEQLDELISILKRLSPDKLRPFRDLALNLL